MHKNVSLRIDWKVTMIHRWIFDIILK